MSEYGWTRGYCLWGLPMGTGVRFFAAVYARKTGDNLIAQHYRRKRAHALAAEQE